MKVAQLLEASRGEQAMDVLDYIEEVDIPSKHKPGLIKLSAKLLADGWDWTRGLNRFGKTVDGSFVGIYIPSDEWQRNSKNKVDFISAHRPSGAQWRSVRVPIAIAAEDPDEFVRHAQGRTEVKESVDQAEESDELFMLRMAHRYFEKHGFAARIYTIAANLISIKSATDISVQIYYKGGNPKPWDVLWFVGGRASQRQSFAEFEEVVDDVSPLKIRS